MVAKYNRRNLGRWHKLFMDVEAADFESVAWWLAENGINEALMHYRIDELKKEHWYDSWL